MDEAFNISMALGVSPRYAAWWIGFHPSELEMDEDDDEEEEEASKGSS